MAMDKAFNGSRGIGRPSGMAAGLGSVPGLAAAERHGNNGQQRRSSAGAASGSSGAWLGDRQYQEYLALLRERSRAPAVVSAPLERVAYPTMSINATVPNRPAYGLTQPGYSFLAPAGTAGKASGYAGLPTPTPVGLPPQVR